MGETIHRGQWHWKTEVVASSVEMLSGRKKKDYEAETAADALAVQAGALGEASSTAASEPIPTDGAESEPSDEGADAEAA
jgi:single-stranded DNA-binding protein